MGVGAGGHALHKVNDITVASITKMEVLVAGDYRRVCTSLIALLSRVCSATTSTGVDFTGKHNLHVTGLQPIKRRDAGALCDSRPQWSTSFSSEGSSSDGTKSHCTHTHRQTQTNTETHTHTHTHIHAHTQTPRHKHAHTDLTDTQY